MKEQRTGEDFDALIKEYNEDPGMNQIKNDLFTDGEMVSEFEDATKSIEPGEITMCKSDYGYHIIKRLPIRANRIQSSVSIWKTINQQFQSGSHFKETRRGS